MRRGLHVLLLRNPQAQVAPGGGQVACGGGHSRADGSPAAGSKAAPRSPSGCRPLPDAMANALEFGLAQGGKFMLVKGSRRSLNTYEPES